jgi:hypothetical protein
VIIKRKIPPVEELHVRAELVTMNSNMEKLSDALDDLIQSVRESSERNKRQDERQAFLGKKVGEIEATLAEMCKEPEEKKPSKITIDVTGRNEITGQIDQVELNIEP